MDKVLWVAAVLTMMSGCVYQAIAVEETRGAYRIELEAARHLVIDGPVVVQVQPGSVNRISTTNQGLEVSEQGQTVTVSHHGTAKLVVQLNIRELESLELTHPASKVELAVRAKESLRLASLVATDVCLVLRDGARLDLTTVLARAVQVDLVGHGKLIIPQLRAEMLQLTLDGHGDVQLGGEVDVQAVSLNGQGHYGATKLASKRARIDLQGYSASRMWVSESAWLNASAFSNAKIAGTATIMRGWPSVADQARLAKRGWPSVADQARLTNSEGTSAQGIL